MEREDLRVIDKKVAEFIDGRWGERISHALHAKRIRNLVEWAYYLGAVKTAKSNIKKLEDIFSNKTSQSTPDLAEKEQAE